jgi:GT2 family glycosyltransferase
VEHVAIIIPTHGPASLLSDCLESVAMQEPRPTEVILVANGCEERVRGIVERAPIAVTMLPLVRNEGFSVAVNRGILASRSEFVLVLNDDAILGEGCIRSLLDETKDRRFGSFAPLVLSLDGSSVQSAGLMFSSAGYGNRSNRDTVSVGEGPKDIFSACGAAALYRRAALEDVGLFNEEFFFFFEDLELGFRLQLRDHRCRLVPKARVRHAGGVTARRVFSAKVEQCLANSLTTAITCMPLDWLLRDKQRMARFYVSLLRTCWAEGCRASVVNGLLRAFGRLPKALRSRRRIQKSARCDGSYLRSLVYHGDVKVGFPGGERIISFY